MRVGIVGATSGTGRWVVSQAIERGHDVMQFVRDPAKVPAAHAGHGIVVGDARRVEDLQPAVRGRDAMICILAADDAGPHRVVSDGVLALCRAMRAEGVQRVVLCSARPVVAVRPRLIIGLLWLWLGNAYRDLARAEGVLAGSELDWRIGRPGRLTDRPGAGAYARDLDDLDASRARDLPRADLARALLDLAEDESASRRAFGLGGAA